MLSAFQLEHIVQLHVGFLDVAFQLQLYGRLQLNSAVINIKIESGTGR